MVDTGETRLTQLEQFRQFREDFKLSSTEAGEGSARGEEEVEELKKWHQKFKLQLDKSEDVPLHNGQGRPEGKETPSTLLPPKLAPPSSRPQSKHQKKRTRPPPKMRRFLDVYELTGEVLGKGASSSVTTCRHRGDNKEFAVKIVPKDKSGVREKVHREIEILYLCRNNRSILQLLESIEENDKFYLVFEKMHGGPLLDHIQKRERFTEREACEVIREVATALAFLHEQGVAHRDLKPQNVLCARKNEILPVRICDFDLSSMTVSSATPTKTPTLFTPVGSAEYMAPEVVETFRGDVFSYDKKCDLWSLGVMVYMMLSGRPPFSGQCGEGCGWGRGEECAKCQDLLLTSIMNGQYDFPEKEWSSVSSEAKDLIAHLLVRDTSQRFSAMQVLSHPWLSKATPDTPLATPGLLSSSPSITGDLGKFAASCARYSRQLSSTESGCGNPPRGYTHPFTLSPPSSSELVARRKQLSPEPVIQTH